MVNIEMMAWIIAKIIEGALNGDLLKVKSYAEHIVKYLDKHNEGNGAKIIRSMLDGTYKKSNKVILD